MVGFSFAYLVCRYSVFRTAASSCKWGNCAVPGPVRGVEAKG